MAKLHKYTYDELSKPLDEVQKVHNDTLADYANMSETSELLTDYLDKDRDKLSVAMYQNFKNELDWNVNDFAKNGLTRENGNRLLRLHRNYNNNVMNVANAVKAREEEREAQAKKLAETNGQAIFSEYANDKSVDDYLQGHKGYVQQNLDDIKKDAIAFAKQASTRHYDNNLDEDTSKQKVFNNEFWDLMESTGYDYKQAYSILQTLRKKYFGDSSEYPAPTADKEQHYGFLRNLDDMLIHRNFSDFNENDRGRMITAYMEGIDEGLTYDEKHNLHRTQQSEMAIKKSGAGKTIINNNVKTGGGGGPAPVVDMDEQYNYQSYTSTLTYDEKKIDSALEKLAGIDILQAITTDEQIGTTKDLDMSDISNPTWVDVPVYKQKKILPTKEDAAVYTYNKWAKSSGQPEVSSYEEYKKKFNEAKSQHQGDLTHFTESHPQFRADGRYEWYVKQLKDTLYLDDSDIKYLIENQIDLDEFVDTRKKLLKEWASPQEQRVYTLGVTDSKRDDVAYKSLSRMAGVGGIPSDLKVNPKDGTYEFGGKVELNKVYKWIKDYGRGLTMDIVYAPQKNINYNNIKNCPYYIRFGFPNDEECKPVFLPLSAVAAASTSEVVNALNKAGAEVKKKIDKLAEEGYNVFDENTIKQLQYSPEAENRKLGIQMEELRDFYNYYNKKGRQLINRYSNMDWKTYNVAADNPDKVKVNGEIKDVVQTKPSSRTSSSNSQNNNQNGNNK